MIRQKLRQEKGSWLVERDCCTSGNCATCHGVTPFGKPLRIVHGSGWSERYAKQVAHNWTQYNAVAKEGNHDQ
jgi:mono/diheme cytochrome c family protein